MIRVENLKKVYNAKKDKPCAALRGVSFTLPERGMVFVVGKSGSGKSTLLKLLGGLDSVTEGDVIVGGKRFSEFTEADYDDYRNNFVGFVFQDFCLIDSMSVYENAKLSLDLCGKDSPDEVNEALRVVDLSDLSGRYPKELSGGQQQRVALARALVKKQSLILADEPTGNLDQRTAKQVLDYLKELSAERLVVIVSHNVDDADKYADRIIELADGLVVRDVSRSQSCEDSVFVGNRINIPTKRRLTKDELERINEAVRGGDVVIAQDPDDFTDTSQPSTEGEIPYQPSGNKMLFKDQLRLSKILFKGNRIHAAITVFAVSVLLILLSLCRVFVSFDGKALIHDSVTSDTSYSFSLYKGYRTKEEPTTVQTDRLVEISDDDVQRFYDEGYEGKIYKLYNVTLALLHNDWNTLEEGDQISYSDAKSPYINLAGGVLECDKEFLDGIYGEGNSGITVLAGDLSEATPRAIIITDYFADSILKYIPTLKTYDDIINEVAIGYTKFDVKAIVKTGYAERYASLIAEFERIAKLSEGRDEEFEKLKKDDRFIDFYEEVKEYLSIGYYFGTGYEAEDEAYVQSRGGTSFDNLYLTVGGQRVRGRQWAYMPSDELAEDEIQISLWTYNEIFGTRYNAEEIKLYFTPFTLTLSDYPYHTAEGEPTYEKTFKVTGISYGPVLMSYRNYLELYKTHLYAYGLYFDNTESAATVFVNMEGGNFFLGDEYYKTIYTIMDIVSIFNDFFLLLYAGLVTVCALILVAFARRSIKRRMYEIGILRALGCKNKTVAGIFMLNMALVSFIIALISIVSVRVLDPVLNSTLIENLSVILDVTLIKDLKILQFDILSAVVDVLTIILLGFFASLGVFLSCRKIKPISIIQKGE